MNLPNAITAGRILSTPFIAALPFIPSSTVRLGAFVLYIVAAVTDYYDGKLARTRNLVTDLGRVLDPLADKLLLFATLIPMYALMSPRDAGGYEFMTPLGKIGLPIWVLLLVVGREVFMTVFRQVAARRGIVISAIGPAKWKTGFQSTWVGAAYFWFFAATAAEHYAWTGTAWNAFMHFNGIVGAVTMVAAVFLTVYSLVLYLKQYRQIFAR